MTLSTPRCRSTKRHWRIALAFQYRTVKSRQVYSGDSIWIGCTGRTLDTEYVGRAFREILNAVTVAATMSLLAY
jgi:hypothetical protein